MNILESIVLGIFQGIGEFFPISSTAHLIIIPWLLGWDKHGLAFDVGLHLGTLIAVVSYFWKEWVGLVRSFFRTLRYRRTESNDDKLIWFIILATIPGAGFGWALEDKAETVFRSPLIISISLISMGLLLFLADRITRKSKSLEDVTLLSSVIIGISQAIAIIPGVSRSGITITACLFQNLKRDIAARFSFLLSTPIILGAVILKSPYIIQNFLELNFLIGFITSVLFGFLSIKCLLQFVQKRSYTVFVVYRVIFGLLIILIWLLR